MALYRRMLQRLRRLSWAVRELQWLRTAARTLADIELRSVLAETLAKTPANPALSGFRVFSQSDEDGIIAEIFRRIGHGRTFLEIGCGDGLENNTHLLALNGWSGIWIDGDPSNIARIRSTLPDSDRLKVVHRFVTPDNVSDLPEVDFLSIDIDGNDLPVLLRLAQAQPSVICVEYNAAFPPPTEISIQYDPDHVWNRDMYHGASLQSFVNNLPDYKLVACSLAGTNAFFVRRDLAGDFATYSTTELYQPCRFHLYQLPSHHRPTMRFLADCLGSRPHK